MPPYSQAASQPTLDTALVAAAATGDRAAVSEVLSALRPLVFRYCLGRLGSAPDGASDAEDCAQDVLLAVLGALPGYSYAADGFMGFVFGIAAHKVSDVYRRRARDRSSPVADPPAAGPAEPDPTVDEVVRADALDWSAGLLDTLPPRQREILVLRIILGLTAEETAAAMGLSSAGAVRVAQHRALNTLRRGLAGRVE